MVENISSFMLKGYYLADKGRFDVALVLDGSSIAETNGDEIVKGVAFDYQRDIQSVLAFADYCDLPLDVRFWA